MKRVMAFILIFSLCLSLAACGGTGNETNNYNNQEFVIPAEHNGSDWVFFMEPVNSTDDTLTLEALIITEFIDGRQTNFCSFKGQTLNMLPFEKRVLEPGESITWNDMCPLDVAFNCIEYRHIFRDSRGQEFQIVYLFEMNGDVPAGGGQAAPTQAPAKLPVAFEVDDGLVDSTNDIVIDFYEFLHEKEEEHKAALNLPYSDEFMEEHTPDFYDTLNLVSSEEIKKLQNTPMRMSYEKTTKAAALNDVDLLFRIFESYYGAYFYYGGKEFFDPLKETIIEEIKNGPDTLTLDELACIIAGNLDFNRDRHMHIGEHNVCEYNNVTVYDFFVKDLYFYQDDLGYYTIVNDRKWYLQQVGNNEKILDYLQITVDENGQLCYCLLLCEPKNGEHLNIHEITLSRGDRTAAMPIAWTKFRPRKNDQMIQEVTTIRNNIPSLNIRYSTPPITREEDRNKSNEQWARVRQMSQDYLAQDVFIFDCISGNATIPLFESIPHSCTEFIAFRLSQLAEDLNLDVPWDVKYSTYQDNQPSSEGDVEKGQYSYLRIRGLWGANDTLIFTVQDKHNFSQSEADIHKIRAIENCLTIGGSTGGEFSRGGGSTVVLYNTGLSVELAESFGYGGTRALSDLCVKPDIWCEPDEAAEAAYRICAFYGIENTADASTLAQYNYSE